MSARKILSGAAVFVVVAFVILAIWAAGRNETAGFLPHATCYLWNRPLIYMHVSADALIGLSYVAISLTLALLVAKARRNMPFHWMFLAFGAFIIACGATHLMEVWTVWSPRYWLSGNVKVVTALASLATALVLPPLVPRILALLESARLSNERAENLRAAHHELEGLYERVKEIDALKTQFFANVSHELRTPLALIFGPVDSLLSDNRLAPEQRRHLNVVRRNAMMLHKQVSDLLDLSKLEAGKLGVERRREDLASLLRLVTSYFESISTERRIKVEIDAPASLPAYIDSAKVQRVLINLLSNAIKFTPPDGRIRCRLTADKSAAIVRVEDSGPGVPEGEREAVFQRFVSSGGVGSRFSGTGLGLAIVKEFVDLHDGTVTVENSTELGGAAFEVRIPIEIPDDAAPAIDHPIRLTELETESAAVAVGESGTEAELAETGAHEDGALKPLILVVDDNLEMRQFIASILKDEFRVRTVMDGREALRIALESKPDLVVTDMMMPEMTGEELIVEMRRHEQLAMVPVILVTAKADDTLEINLLESGAQDFIRKPFSTEELRARVRNHAATKRVRDTLQEALASHTQDIDQLAREITVRTRELSVAKEQAEAASLAKDRFLAVLSHELRTPLTPVLATVASLEQYPELSPEVREAMRMIRRNVELETRLIDDLLDLNRATQGKLRLNNEVVDAHALIGNAVEICETEGRDRGVKVDMQLEAMRSRVRGDWPRLLQVFWNLLQNAIKFTGNNGNVLIRSEDAGDGRLRIQVKDNGIGIPSEALPKVFEVFEQGGKTITQRYGGLGIGLAVARMLIEAHEGTIAATSEGEGKGTTITVELPTTADEPAAVAPEEDAPEGHRQRILLVEDHTDTREVLQRLLKRWGYIVAAAASLGEAREKMEDQGFDLLLTDVGLPDGRGIDLLADLRRHNPGVQGIAVSGFGMERDLSASRDAGFVEHITKPVAPDRLRKAVAAALASLNRGGG